MACFHPLTAYQAANGDVTFTQLKRYDIVKTLQLPCGQCVGCRLERSRQWATRCVHESTLHEHNAFITLTYDDANCPPDRSLNYRHFQLFMKRLRKHFSPQLVRFYMCGEYGSDFDRPHFHACLFGINFTDKTIWKKTGSDCNIYRSFTLEHLWPYGFSSIGDVTFESAAYVARYIMKKINGEMQDDHYTHTDPETGELIRRTPEFTKMSLKPGVGAGWFERWSSDVYPHDYVITRGVKSRPPRYYDKKLEKINPDQMEAIKFARELTGRAHYEDQTDDRLADREKVASAGLNLFPRQLK